MTKYGEKDAAKETGVSEKEVRETYHGAREAARKDGRDSDRSTTKGWKKK